MPKSTLLSSRATHHSIVNSDRPFTTLFLLVSAEGKISTGDADEMDVDQDYPHLLGGKEGLQQYYDLKTKTDQFSLNTGRVFAVLTRQLLANRFRFAY